MRASIKVLLSAVAIGLFTSGKADAGLKGSWPVVIDTVNRSANGSMGSARAGAGGQYIGCWMAATGIEDNGGDAVLHAGCWAKNAAGVAVSCVFPNQPASPSNVPPLYVTSRDALVSFTWDANNVCTAVETWVYANLLPTAR